MEDCGGIPPIQKKYSKDPGMPNSVVERRDTCLEWMCRPYPMSSPNASDNEAGDDEGSDREDVVGHDSNIVAALLGLGSGEGVSGVGGSDDNGEAEC